MTQKLLDLAGIGKERLHLAWVSSAEAQRFADIATKVTASIKEQGKLDTEACKMEIAAAEMTVNGDCVRWLTGKEVTLTTKGDVYGRKWDENSYEAILDTMLEREYQKNLIFLAIKEGYTSVRDVSAKTGLDLLRVSYLLADLEQKNRVEFTGMEDSKPVFAAL